MITEVTTGLPSVNFAPATVVEEVLQNVAAIISTRQYTVPLDREFGVAFEFLDEPMPVAMAKASTEIISAIQQHEPRCRVLEVTFDGDGADGVLKPRVKVDIPDG